MLVAGTVAAGHGHTSCCLRCRKLYMYSAYLKKAFSFVSPLSLVLLFSPALYLATLLPFLGTASISGNSRIFGISDISEIAAV